MQLSIGSDHAGYEFKQQIISHLESGGHTVINRGTNSPESVDYPDFAHLVAEDVEQNEVDLGIVICGSGNGVAMAANKHKNIRAAIAWTEEIAALSRQHNDANILSIPARFVSIEVALQMVDVFIQSSFEGGRHQRRVNKISCL